MPTYEPQTWYALTVRCNTAGDGTDEHPPCINYLREWEVNPVYSPTGSGVNVVCAPCSQQVEVLTAVKLVPQPVFDE